MGPEIREERNGTEGQTRVSGPQKGTDLVVQGESVRRESSREQGVMPRMEIMVESGVCLPF